MKSVAPGKCTSVAEVLSISKHRFWLLLADEELFVPFKSFPFKDASIADVLKVEWLGINHLYWPELDVDLAVESIRKPERFPLVSKQSLQTKRSSRQAKAGR